MLIRALLIVLPLLAACGERVEVGTRSEAQAVGPGNLSKVTVLDGGLCTGTGTTADPFNCSVTTAGAVSGTGSAGSPLTLGASLDAISFGLMGDGSDGTFVFDGSTTFVDRRGVSHVPSGGVYTQTNDVFCNGCTINVGVTVNPNGFRFYDRGTLTLNGKVARNGNNASGVTGGTASTVTAVSYFNGSSGTQGGAGGNGGAGGGAACGAGGVTSDSVNASGTGLNCENSGGAAGSPGAVGGKCHGGGGGNGGNGTACAGGTVGLFSLQNSNFRMFNDALSGRYNRSGGTTRSYMGGSGGGGGRGASTPTAYGGGGGGGGGVVHVYAAKIVGTGSVEAKGGTGANGEATNNTGGGGGGGGGIAVVLVGAGPCPTIDVTGGAGGAGNGTGANGGAGGSGVSRCYVMR